MTRKQILTILALTLSVCCIGLILFGLLLPESEETQGPTTIPTDSPTPATTTPIEASSPTPKPVPTSTPTQVPTVTPKPTPATSLEEAQYLTELLGHVLNLTDALETLSGLAAAPNLLSDDWKMQMAAQIAAIRLTHEALKAMDVPPRMAEIHEAVLDATADCDAATYYLTEGIDNLDSGRLDEAGRLVQRCGEKIQKPARMIEELSE